VDLLKESANGITISIDRKPRALKKGTLSPLRYPGGKRRLAAYVADILTLNGLRPRLFVEPFAGGASVSLYLLQEGLVETIALGEIDPLVTSFWNVVFNDHQWLIDQIAVTKPTLELWQRLRAKEHKTDRERALACLVLNRTSFSGILAPTAGPLGGLTQKSENTIDCRFYPETIIARITALAAYRKQVLFIANDEWQRTIARVRSRRYNKNNVVFYFDPPFYNKADRLYRYYFAEDDHRALRDTLVNLDAHWITSYDPADEIVRLYRRKGVNIRFVELLYSAMGRGKLVGAQELILTNIAKLPEPRRLWKTAAD
jgi:DNA adenine methylase